MHRLFPTTRATKRSRSAREIELLREFEIDLVVMASCRQNLSEQMIKALPMRIIDVHHSLLPAFQGGRLTTRAAVATSN